MSQTPRQELSLFDSTCLIVGIILGTGIYVLAPGVASGAGVAWAVPVIWVVGGLLSLSGALGYAELASAYPEEGGDYVYLNRAYGPWAGFLFGWVQLFIVRPGDIAVMAFAFSVYYVQIGDPLRGTGLDSQVVLACAAVVLVTVINILGVRQGKWTQNILTVVKALGLLTVVGVAFFCEPTGRTVEPPVGETPLRVAMIFVLFCYGGWNEMAYVAAEVRNPKRNILRALVLGTVAVTVLYLLANAAFLRALGYEGLAGSEAVAADAVAVAFPRVGAALISGLICLSALGALNGLVFTGARISYAMGTDHRVFGRLGHWSPRTGTPIWALILQAAITVGLIVALRGMLGAILYTASAVYSFYLATSLAVVVLRWKEPNTPRPYRVTSYPVPTLLFCVACVLLIHGAIVYKPLVAVAAGGIFLLGIPVYLLSRRMDVKPGP
ncbi:MAG: amino acid permease [Pirellulales bacterium]|nr:amino acid permease [Pirellulales bacterium]